MHTVLDFGHKKMVLNPNYITMVDILPAKQETVKSKEEMVNMTLVMYTGIGIEYSCTKKFGEAYVKQLSYFWSGEDEPEPETPS